MTIKTSEIEFGDPPKPRTGGGGDHVKPTVVHQLAPLRERPGEWARVYGPLSNNSARSKVRHIHKGVYVGVPKGEYEATSRHLDDGTYVWVRYIGHTNGASP